MNMKRLLRITLKLITLPIFLIVMPLQIAVGYGMVFGDWLNDKKPDQWYSTRDMLNEDIDYFKNYFKNLFK